MVHMHMKHHKLRKHQKAPIGLRLKLCVLLQSATLYDCFKDDVCLHHACLLTVILFYCCHSGNDSRRGPETPYLGQNSAPPSLQLPTPLQVPMLPVQVVQDFHQVLHINSFSTNWTDGTPFGRSLGKRRA